MKLRLLMAAAIAALAMSCSEDELDMGVGLMPIEDGVTSTSETYNVSTNSYKVDGNEIVSRSSMCHIGQFTEPETNTSLKSEFLAQFHCLDNFSMPEKSSLVTGEALQTEVLLFYSGYVGDSLNANKLAVYPVKQGVDFTSADTYSSGVSLEDYYDSSAKPFAVKNYSAADRVKTDSVKSQSDFYPNIQVMLPNSFGTKLMNEYYRDPSQFANSAAFIKDVLPGFVFKHESGDGTIMNIDVAQINVYFKYYLERKSTGIVDSLATGVISFASTEEVMQVSTVNHKNIDNLVNDESCTYLKTPAGIFTEVKLPMDEILNSSHANDTINTARIIFTRYNSENESEVTVGAPKTLLLIRKPEWKKFFSGSYVPNEVSSFLATLSTSTNTYTFSNIAKLLSYNRYLRNSGATGDETGKTVPTAEQLEKWYKENPDWDKVLLIPVETTTTSTSSYYYGTSTTVVGVNHDFSVSSTKLVGGKDNPVELKIIYSKFYDGKK